MIEESESRKAIDELVALAREERDKTLKNLCLFEANNIRIDSLRRVRLVKDDSQAYIALLRLIIADMEQIIVKFSSSPTTVSRK